MLLSTTCLHWVDLAQVMVDHLIMVINRISLGFLTVQKTLHLVPNVLLATVCFKLILKYHGT